ncbi:MAG: serine hydrolase [Acidobacteria bacterium]|nr:serine hydrolase [Acidobacteriota bacterium]
MNNKQKNLSFLKLLLVSLVLALPLCSYCKAQQKTDFKELETIAAQELKETGTPGAAVVIVSGDRIVFAKGFGVSNVETGQAVTTDMLFRIGSMTKPFTAATLVGLSEEGKIKLDAPVGNYVKGLSSGLGQVTLHQLLSHTAGIQDGARSYGSHDEKELAKTVRSWKDDLLFTSPGKIFSYSNLGFNIAGVAIEEGGGKPFADQFDERLFKPLGMNRTTFRPTVAMTYPLAQDHQARGGGKALVVRPFTDNAADWAAGFMFSSADELARFAIAFMNEGKIDGKQVLPPAVIRKMSAPYADIPGFDIKYGYGMRIEDYRGVRMIEHGGAIAGFGAQLRMVPEHRFAIIVLGNKSGARLEKTVEKAMEILLPLKAKSAQSTPQPIAMSESEMTNYVGNYVHSARASMEIVMQNGKLFWKRRDELFLLVKTGNYRFMIPSPDPNELEEFVFVMGSEGKVEYLHMDGRAYKRQ